MYKVASKVCDPEEPRLKPYEKLCELLKAHLSPVVSVVAERFKFRNCLQESEQIHEYVIKLKSAAQQCRFGIFLNEALRDQFVAGIRDGELRKQLLRQEDVSFEKATAIARTWEAAKDDNETIRLKPHVGEMAAIRERHRATVLDIITHTCIISHRSKEQEIVCVRTRQGAYKCIQAR